MRKGAGHVVIIGGGITGLAAAFSLGDTEPEVSATASRCTLIEAAPDLGGKILTESVDGFLIEGGPDSFLAQKPWGIDLCRRLRLSDSLIGTNAEHRKTFVLLGNRLRELPEGLIMGLPTKLGPFIRSGLLSWAGKFRIAAEVMIPPRRDTGDESLASFFRRRLGKEALERLIEPLLTGMYTGDAEQLSLLATFPRFREMEQEDGSLIRSILRTTWKVSRGAQHGVETATPFVTLREGMGALVQALAGQLRHTTVMTGTRVQEIRRDIDRLGYEVVLDNGSVLNADAVIITTPAFAAATLLDPLDKSLAEQLNGIPYASSATVSLGFLSKDVGHDLNGYGFVVPRIEHRTLIASTWTSSKWDHRAPSGKALIRCYFGGVGRESVLERTDNELEQLALDELRTILKLQATPVVTRVYRWPRAMPQYQVGHLKRLINIAERLEQLPGLVLAGAGYRGVGLPDCIRDGMQAADTVRRYFDKIAAASV